MSEYWKSVPRKFCDFCKCWITDNKPSVDFHERGKRHQENVQLRLTEVRKKSLQTAKEDDEMKKSMEKMEKAALEAFKKDLKDNPELAAQYGVSLEPKPKPSDKEEKSTSSESTVAEKAEGKKKMKPKVKEWYEASSPEGYSYYWNTVTGESKWEPPDEYVSIAEQENLEKEEQAEADKKNVPAEDNAEEDSASLQTAESSEESKQERVDPGNSRSAYGAWNVVKVVEQPKMYDETSAPPELDEIPLPQDVSEEAKPKPQRPKFKEKTVTSIGSSSGEPVAFKKRKIASGARNVRHRDNDD